MWYSANFELIPAGCNSSKIIQYVRESGFESRSLSLWSVPLTSTILPSKYVLNKLSIFCYMLSVFSHVTTPVYEITKRYICYIQNFHLSVIQEPIFLFPLPDIHSFFIIIIVVWSSSSQWYLTVRSVGGLGDS